MVTTAQVVEEALRAYAPPVDEASPAPSGLVRKGRLWVMPAAGRRISLEEANAALEAARTERD
jgi:hypothetical protein